MRIALAVAVALGLASITTADPAQASIRKQTNIPAQQLGTALKLLAKDRNLQLIYLSDSVDRLPTPGAVGTFTADEVLNKLLSGTGLTYKYLDDSTITVAPIKNSRSDDTRPSPTEGRVGGQSSSGESGGDAKDGRKDNNSFWSRVRLAQAGEGSSSADGAVGTGDKVEEYTPTAGKAIPEILVTGSTSLNVDIRRSVDDVQPYVIFDREKIERSSAADLEGFLKTQLPMNTALSTSFQDGSSASLIQGQINMRGLGANQTLILVDGRRVAGASVPTTGIQQADISGIPLSSIERIEVLPTTAGAIYGGSATGGVINIIRKKDYSGVDLSAKYGNTFSSDFQEVEFNANFGTAFNEGRTSITVSAGHSTSGTLLVSRRAFGARSRALVLANDPSTVTEATFPINSTTPNVCSAIEITSTIGFCGGDPLTLDGGQPVGAVIAAVPKGYAGPQHDGGAAFLGTGGQYNMEIPDDGQYLLRSPDRDSASVSFRQKIGSHVELLLEGSGNRNVSDVTTGASSVSLFFTADDPANPFQQPVVATVPVRGVRNAGESRSDLVQMSASLIVRISKEWSIDIDRDWSRTRNSYELTAGDLITVSGQNKLRAVAFGDLPQDSLDLGSDVYPPDTHAGPFSTILESTTLRVSGSAFRLPGGDVSLSGAVSRRSERMRDTFSNQNLSFGEDVISSTTYYPKQWQKVDSYYLEGRAPLVSEANQRTFLSNLEIESSIRRDKYETIATRDFPSAETPQGPFAASTYFTNKLSSTDFMVGLRYSPGGGVVLRSSLSSGFLAPAFSQITPVSSVVRFAPGVADPKRGGTRISVPYTQIRSGDPDVLPEQSKSWSAGAIITPLEGLRFSFDYTHISKSDEIVPGDIRYILANESLFPGRVIRGPNLPTDQAGWAGPISQINISNFNALSTAINSIDIQVDFKTSTIKGNNFSFTAVASNARRFDRQIAAGVPAVDSIGYSFGPLRWKVASIVEWRRGHWGVSWSTQHFDSYSITSADPSLASFNDTQVKRQGSSRIRSQTYHDLFFRYQPPTRNPQENSGLLADSVISFGVENVFGTVPPVLATATPDILGAGTYSTYGDPRLRRYFLSFQKSFGK